MSTLQSELAAIRDSAGIFPLNHRAFLRIAGTDATRWLNGMVTNNIKDLAPGHGNYNFLLNAQGRIQGDCHIYCLAPEEYLLETTAAQIETIYPLLDKFIIMDDVELTPAPVRIGLLLTGAEATHLLATLNLPADLAPHQLADLTWHDAPLTLIRTDDSTYELWSDVTTTNTIASQLHRAGAQYLSPATIEAHRILTAQPLFGQDIRDKDLPQETAQTHALHFTKGCYLGQEIVERIHSRGNVHRTFTRFQLTGTLPTLPAPLEASGKPAGELTSAVQIGPILIALGYLRREFATAPLTYPGGTATPKSS